VNGTYVGIDLSLTSTGLAIIQDGAVHLHRVTSKGARGDDLTSRRDRLNGIVNEIAAYVPVATTTIAIEGPSYGQRQQSGVHDRSGLWWLTLDGLTRIFHVPIIEIPPAVRAKYATGKGNASKDAVLAAVCRRYPDVDVTGNDVADALILAAIAARLDGEPIEAAIPAVNVTALDKLTVSAELRAGAR
jgi:crossover junction endodeoxyribonuclease RuvC